MGSAGTMSDKLIVNGADGDTGDRGEQLLAGTDRIRVRLWEGEEAGVVAPDHANDYDYVAYVLSGALEVHVGDEGPTEVRAGDSYAVPAGTTYGFQVLEAAKVVEAITL
jgi:quercetin dioxygenase-like cupin family protein